MKKPLSAPVQAHGYVLSEESQVELQEIRDNLFLIARVAFAVTQEEENIPLEIRRSILAQCFETFGLRIDDVLDTLTWHGRKFDGSTSAH